MKRAPQKKAPAAKKAVSQKVVGAEIAHALEFEEYCRCLKTPEEFQRLILRLEGWIATAQTAAMLASREPGGVHSRN